MKRTALLIDDDADAREIIAAILESAGFETDVVGDGIDALDPQKDYSLILLDMNMPIFDGERLVSYWLLTRPEIVQRVIILTGYSRSARSLPRTFASITKPVNLAELLEVVERCWCAQQDSNLEA